MTPLETIKPDWPLQDRITLFTTTRVGGVSQPPYDSLNLGLHSGDQADHVQRNRDVLSRELQLPSEPQWLRQTHGVAVRDNYRESTSDSYDAAWTDEPGRVLVILTADCLPVAFANETGTELALAHAGWRGLADGVLQQTAARFKSAPETLQVWLGPAIGPQHFEVGDDVYERFKKALPGLEIERAFHPGVAPGKWFADLYLLARVTLATLGIHNISGGEHCTYGDAERFFSYRRDGVQSGRIATLGWING